MLGVLFVTMCACLSIVWCTLRRQRRQTVCTRGQTHTHQHLHVKGARKLKNTQPYDPIEKLKRSIEFSVKWCWWLWWWQSMVCGGILVACYFQLFSTYISVSALILAEKSMFVYFIEWGFFSIRCVGFFLPRFDITFASVSPSMCLLLGFCFYAVQSPNSNNDNDNVRIASIFLPLTLFLVFSLRFLFGLDERWTWILQKWICEHIRYTYAPNTYIYRSMAISTTHITTYRFLEIHINAK